MALGTNGVIVVIRFSLNSLRLVPCHAVFLMYYMLVYCVYSWWYYRNNGYFFYFFLDFRRKFSFVAYAALPAPLVGMHLLLSTLV